MVGIKKEWKIMYSYESYKIIHGARGRCYNKNNTKYKFYGGRGIKVCDCVKNPQNFMFWMGERPSKNHELDRIDNDKDYCACTGNLRWTTRKNQMLNTNQRKRKEDFPRGVCFDNDRKKYIASIGKDGTNNILGRFDTIEEAHQEFLNYYFIIHNTYPPEFMV